MARSSDGWVTILAALLALDPLHVPESESAAVRLEAIPVRPYPERGAVQDVLYRAPASNVAPSPSSTPGQDVTYSDARPGSDTSTQ
jgi:hypothetical protein